MPRPARHFRRFHRLSLRRLVRWCTWPSAETENGLQSPRIWKLPEAKEVLPSPGPISPSAGMALSHDGRHLAISGSAGVRLWSAESGWKSLTGSLGWTSPDQVSLAFNRDGTRLAGPGKDDTLLIWNTATGQEVARLYYYQAALVKDVAIRAVAYSPDEKEIFALGANWATYRFTVPLEDLPAEARRLAGKTPLTDQDCAAYLHQTPCPPQVRRIASVPQ